MINAVGPAVRFIGRLAQIVIALVGCSMLVAGHMTVGVFRRSSSLSMRRPSP